MSYELSSLFYQESDELVCMSGNYPSHGFVQSDALESKATSAVLPILERLIALRKLFAYGMRPRDITQRNLLSVESDVRNIYLVLDTSSDLRDLFESIDAVQSDLVEIIVKLNLAADILDMPMALKRREHLYDLYREIAEYLSQVIAILEKGIFTRTGTHSIVEQTNLPYISSKELKEEQIGTFPSAEKQEIPPLSVIVRARFEENDKTFVNEIYTVQAGISQSTTQNIQGSALDIPISYVTSSIAFDILLHGSENVEFIGEWRKHLVYVPYYPHPQIVEFTFQMTTSGSSFLVLDFYRELCWVKTVQLKFNVIEKLSLSSELLEG